MKVKIISKNIKPMMISIVSLCRPRTRFKNTVRAAHITVDPNQIRLCQLTDKISYLEPKTFKDLKLIITKIILKETLSMRSKIKCI